MNDNFSTFERRIRILAILINRDIVTKPELSRLFSVSEDAIDDDLVALDRIVCIRSKRGRYGGMYIENKPLRGQAYFMLSEENLLRELLPTLDGKNKRIMEAILFRFSMPRQNVSSII